MPSKKPVPWAKIKAEYLQGATPKQLAETYGVTSKQVRDKAYKESWGRQKAIIDDKTTTKIIEKVTLDTNELLNAYKRIALEEYGSQENAATRLKALDSLAKIAGLFKDQDASATTSMAEVDLSHATDKELTHIIKEQA